MNDLARPKKDGLEYFPLDVYAGTDDELELLEAEYGLEGFAIFIKLLQAIYKNGYYINWSDKEKLLFSKRVNVALTLVNNVITTCLKWDLLNNRLYEQHKILTSHGIQQRFLLAIGRRSAVEIYQDYLLLSESEVSATKNLVIVTKTPVNADDNPQSKVKESKEKVKESIAVAADHTAVIQKILEDGFGRLVSPIEIETLLSYLDDGIQLDLIEKAVQETANNGVKNINYVKKILDRCLEQKIYTAERYLLDKASRKNKKGELANNGNTRANRENSESVKDQFAEYAEQNGIQSTSGNGTIPY